MLSILGAVVGEFVGASAGLGMLLMQYNQAMEIAPMFAVILLLAVIGFLMNYAVTLVERRYCFWAQRSNARRDHDRDQHPTAEACPCSTRLCRATLALTLVAGTSAGTDRQRCRAIVKKMTLVQMHPIMGVGEEVFLYAVPKRLGYFAAEGLEVDIQNSQSGMISAQVLQSNNAQVGTTAAAAIMTVREQNGDLISFFNLKRNAGTFLVVLKNSPIQKARRSQGQERRCAVVRRRRRPRPEAEPERNRHHARSVHRHCHRRGPFGDRSPARPARSTPW